VFRVEPAGVHDLAGTYRVRLSTGDAGLDATGLYRDPDLLGHIYVGPYVVGQPGMELVLVDEGGVAGYLLAADDTPAFQDWQESEWWPALRARYPPAEGGSADAELVRIIHAPPHCPVEVAREYPAQLHIDLLEHARGQGLGRMLVERLLTDLRGRGVGGVHLEVDARNSRAMGFYERLGFRELERMPGSVLMGQRLG
jgi:ribosomal protein S18 acetylase RimI-like enzyme